MALEIEVSCYSGYQGEETPRKLVIAGRQLRVVEVLQRARTPEHRLFKVRAEDGAVYLLRYELAADRWQLVG